jgi:hypothetical protein
MKIRIDLTTYKAAQRIADADGLTFSRWAIASVRRWLYSDARPTTTPPLTRTNSVSTAINIERAMLGDDISPLRIRECITLAVQFENEKPWCFRYDRGTLEACITTEQFFGRSCSYHGAQAIMDKRLKDRIEEIKAERKTNRKVLQK